MTNLNFLAIEKAFSKGEKNTLFTISPFPD